MNKLVHRLTKHQGYITAHINRHHKKYIFAAGASIGAGIFKIAAILAMFLGISLTTERSSANNAEIEMYKAMNIFYQINEIAHNEMKESEEYGSAFTQESEERFKELDDDFHEADNLNERYKVARKIVDFLLEQEKTRPHIENDPDSERDDEFRKLLQVFNRMQ